MNDYSDEIREASAIWSRVRVGTAAGFQPNQLVGKSVICIASGCSYPVAHFASIAADLSGAKSTQVMTPYEYLRSSACPDVAIIVSAHGEHIDSLRSYKKLLGHRISTVIVTTRIKSPLTDLVELGAKGNTQMILSSEDIKSGGFIPIASSIAMIKILLEVFCSGCDYLPLFDLARAELDQTRRSLPNFANIKTYIVISSLLGRPASQDFETRIVESAMGVAVISDPWHFGHGRYFSASRDIEVKCAVSFGVAGEESDMTLVTAVLADKMPLVSCQSEKSGLLGSAHCIFKSMLTISAIAQDQEVNPAAPIVPPWGDYLYLQRNVN